MKLINTRQITTTDLHIRQTADGDQSRTVEGYAIVFGQQSVPLWKDSKGEAREVIASESVSADLITASDIKFNMFHDNSIILARSDKGSGSLSLNIDARGVHFEFEMPRSMYGDYALEAIRRGDIKGCSFAFSTDYCSRSCVECTKETSPDGYTISTYTVRRITGLYDMTVTPDPAYPQTSVSLRSVLEEVAEPNAKEVAAVVAALRAAAK